MPDIRTWVSDNLIKLTGASDSTVVDFVLANASDAKSLLSVQGKLSAFLDGPQSDLDAFSRDLYGRLPKNHGNASANGAGQQKVKENGVKKVKKKYRLLEMEDEILEPPNAAPAAKESKKHRSDRDSTDVRKDEKEREGRSHKSKKLRRKEDTDFVGAGTDERSDETVGLGVV